MKNNIKKQEKQRKQERKQREKVRFSNKTGACSPGKPGKNHQKSGRNLPGCSIHCTRQNGKTGIPRRGYKQTRSTQEKNTPEKPKKKKIERKIVTPQIKTGKKKP